MVDERQCSVDGCERPAKKRGWCLSHYGRWLKHGDVRAEEPLGKQHRKGEPCLVADCGKLSHGLGYCGMHLRRFRKHGDPVEGPGRKTPLGEAKRYFEEVVLTYDGDDCLAWPFTTDRMGYGVVARRYVHIRVCEHVHGPPPEPDMEAAHSCGNGRRGCCTKKHLRWKTHAENQAEMVYHGHSQRGQLHRSAKLTEDDIRKIRSLSGTLSQSEIADRFGVNQSHIWKIVHRVRWGWLED